MKQKRQGIKVGSWCFIAGYVELRYDNALEGGCFYSWPSDEGTPYIVVGGFLGIGSWQKVVGVLLHEIFEMGMVLKGRRFSPSPELADSHSNYLFSMDHPQFEEIAYECGDYMANSMPALGKVWVKERKKK